METFPRPDVDRGQPDDSALIEDSCRRADRLGVVFDRHAAAIHGYVARRLGRDAADDLVAETFLVAFRQRHGYDAAQLSARPWLYGIATNLIGRHRRDEVRFLRATARAGIDPAAEPVADQVARRVSAQAAHRQLAAALASLSAADRSVLLLITGGLSYEQAAAALGVPVGTVSSRLARARKKVIAALGGVNPATAEEENQE
jgi:RNA polymerase sigma-70 factor (ECF subfamily)